MAATRPSREFFLASTVTIGTPGASDTKAASVACKNQLSKNQFSKGRPIMTIRTRVALGISAAALSLSLALAPAAFAQDKMSKDDAMKKDTMSKDTMSKDGMKKDDGMMKKN